MTNKVHIISPGEVGFSQFKDAFSTIEWSDNTVYRIDTKYYSCNVHLNTTEISDDSSLLSTSEPSHLIVLLFDQTNEKSFKSIQSFVTKIVEESDGNESIILMEVSNSNQEKDIKVDNNTIEEWCIENAIELLFLNQAKHKAYELLKDSDEDQRIKYGIDRFKEILETTMWDDMEYKTESRPNKLNFNNNDDNDDDDENEETETKDKEVEKLTTTISTTSISDDIKSTAKEEATQPQGLQFENFLKESLKTVETFFDKGAANTGKNTSAEDEEEIAKLHKEYDQFDLFENTLSQLKNMREQMQNLPDNQRREMAAQVALMFASKLGDGDLDFDEEDLLD